MGSTDIRIDNPDDAECDDAEIEYMMTTLRGVFPGCVSVRHSLSLLRRPPPAGLQR